MAKNALGIEVPAATGAFDPQGDMVNLAASIKGRLIIPVPNAAARTALLAAVGSSPDEPLIVRQDDTGFYWEHTGTAWKVFAGGHDSASISPSAPWATFQSALTRRGTLVSMSSRLDRGSGTASTDETIATLPAGFRPTIPIVVAAARYVGGAWSPALVQITTAGSIISVGPSGGSGTLVQFTTSFTTAG